MSLKIVHLPGDSGNYEVIYDAAIAAADVPGVAIEIGLRRGGGSKQIIDAMVKTDKRKTMVAVDPYGNIDYNTVVDFNKGPQTVKMDYTNSMRDQCLVNMYEYAQMSKVNFVFFPLEDTEFFKRFADGIPVYEEFKRLETQYSIVHFDGPHFTDDVLNEIYFFMPRTPRGAAFVFDDVSYYDHSVVDKVLIENGWLNKAKMPYKWSYIKG